MTKIAFVFIGKIAFQGRLLKQISSLQKIKNITSIVYLGNINKEESVNVDYTFKIVESTVHYDKFKLYSFFEQIKFCYLVSRKILIQKTEFIQCCGLQTLLAGVLVKRKNKEVKLLFDNTELSAERDHGIKRWVWHNIQKYCLKYCDYIILPEINRLNYFREKHNLPKEKMLMISNYPNSSIKNSIPNEVPIENVRIVYLGIIGKGRHYSEVINAFKELPSYIMLDIIGPGEKEYVDKIRLLIKDSLNIQILPPVSNKMLGEIVKGYNIGLAFYENTNLNNYYCAPNKIFDYLQNNIPVISNNYPGLLDILEKNKVGVCLPEITAETLHNAINEIIMNKYVCNINHDVKNQYSWEAQEAEYIGLF